MKKLFASLVMLAFFVPCVSFAQSTVPTTYSPQYVALLQQLIKLLEQELVTINTASSVATSTPTVLATTTTSSSINASSTPIGYTGTEYNSDGSTVQYVNGKVVETIYSNGYKSTDGWTCSTEKDTRGTPILDCEFGG